MNNKAESSINLSKITHPSNYYSSLVPNQKIAIVESFQLESGTTIRSAPVAYSTWGTLNENKDNVLIVCHALTGSSDALDWWRPMFGVGKALDCSKYFVFCANVLGSPYGTASPLTIDPNTGRPYGPTFPETTIRDDVGIHKLVLDALGVKRIVAVIGGSMGGFQTLEWALCTPVGFVQNIIPITTSAYQGAWGISWGEAQRQAVYSDAAFRGGWYNPIPEDQPRRGLGTARMVAMLTYRSHFSFEARFGRKPATHTKLSQNEAIPSKVLLDPGCSNASERKATGVSNTFAVQSYLNYQAEKFLSRFDANCYIHLTKKMDTHDVTRGRGLQFGQDSCPQGDSILQEVLRDVPSNSLVVSVETDVLFRPEQQLELARCLPNAQFVALESQDGHDGFLLEFEALNEIIQRHLVERFPRICENTKAVVVNPQEMVGNSVFGEIDFDDF
ncbi:homoserine O-acetyltransferase [Dendryphion nanum]|uniref:Homoserine O-acetyltransferase n=1 Tax=Dendryphion nanum TaxID=256645 RepID=A0A9P9D162_9PLEO|nr:homoserine O-acetyltransferase [Dendryphion nanum]